MHMKGSFPAYPGGQGNLYITSIGEGGVLGSTARQSRGAALEERVPTDNRVGDGSKSEEG